MAVLLRLRFCCGGHLTFGFCLCGPPYLLISSLQLIFGRTLVHRDGVVLVLKRNSEHNLRWFLAFRASFCHSRPRTHGLPVRTGSRVLGHARCPRSHHERPGREDPGPRGPHGVPGLDGLSVSDPGRSCREGSRNWNGTEPRPGHEGPGT
jgi:hypothetical protein